MSNNTPWYADLREGKQFFRMTINKYYSVLYKIITDGLWLILHLFFNCWFEITSGQWTTVSKRFQKGLMLSLWLQKICKFLQVSTKPHNKTRKEVSISEIKSICAWKIWNSTLGRTKNIYFEIKYHTNKMSRSCILNI